MSSTNRSNVRDFHKFDYYVTPQKPIEQFLKRFLENHPNIDREKISVLDPCCGGDAVNEPSYVAVLERMGFKNIHSIDLRGDSKAQIKADFLRDDIDVKPSIIISNPPFCLAQDFIERSLDIVTDGGCVIFLLRLNFLGSKERYQFFQKHMPVEIYVHHRRMGFIPNSSQTDSIEYAHFVWGKGFNPDSSKLYLV